MINQHLLTFNNNNLYSHLTFDLTFDRQMLKTAMSDEAFYLLAVDLNMSWHFTLILEFH